MLTIDGKEAGGQVLRVALGLAAITGQPLRIINIRGARPQPGLKTQHLEGVLAVGRLCNARIKGAELGSTTLEFIPNRIESKHLHVKISTAGSIGLLFQSLQLAAAYAAQPVKISVEGGGTAGKWAPSIDYVRHVFLPIVAKLGYQARIEVLKHGFYPRGGARVEIEVQPIEVLKSLKLLEPGRVKLIRGISIAGSLPKQVAERQAKAAIQRLKQVGIEAEIEAFAVHTLSPGTCIVLWAETEYSVLGTDLLGERGVPAERVGKEAAERLLKNLESKAGLDVHMSDQILPFLALAEGDSSLTIPEITEHVRTNIAVLEQMLGVRFEIKANRPCELQVKGLGLKSPI